MRRFDISVNVSPNSYNSNRELGDEVQKLQDQNKRSFARIRNDLIRLKRRLRNGSRERPSVSGIDRQAA